jgi:6-phosphogluconolactonase (cycloisomerase 2 family)
MKAFISVALIFIIVLTIGCLGSSSSSVAPNLAFVYIVGEGSNSILAQAIKSTGELSSLPLAAFATNPRPVSLALTPSKNFLYVSNQTANTISGFTLDHTTGVLTPIGTAVPPTPVCTSPAVCANPNAVGIDSKGQFLYVLNQGQAPSIPASISIFSIDATRGLLTPIAGSPFQFPSLPAGNPQFLVMSPNSSALYVSTGLSNTIVEFSIASNGTLTQIGTINGAAGGDIVGMTIDSKGQFLYAADFVNDTIASLSVQSNGTLTPVAGSPFPTHSGPFALAVNGPGTFLFSAEQGAAGVSSFTVNSGVLTPVAGSPFVLVSSGSPQPDFAVVDPTNTFLYVANAGTHNISGYTIKPDGTLVALTNSPFGQTVGPQWMVITQ